MKNFFGSVITGGIFSIIANIAFGVTTGPVMALAYAFGVIFYQVNTILNILEKGDK